LPLPRRDDEPPLLLEVFEGPPRCPELPLWEPVVLDRPDDPLVDCVLLDDAALFLLLLFSVMVSFLPLAGIGVVCRGATSVPARALRSRAGLARRDAHLRGAAFPGARRSEEICRNVS